MSYEIYADRAAAWAYECARVNSDESWHPEWELAGDEHQAWWIDRAREILLGAPLESDKAIIRRWNDKNEATSGPVVWKSFVPTEEL